MPTPNPFTSSAFDLIELTAAVNRAPYVPTRIQQLGIFKEQGLLVPFASVDVRDGVLSIVDVRPRGAPGQPVKNQVEATRKAIPFLIPHLPTHARILAAEIQGVRDFGTESMPEDIAVVRDERLATIRGNLDYTNEIHRVSAIKGSFIDANGDSISLSTTFGTSRQTQGMGLHATNKSGIRGKCFEIRKKIRTGMGGAPWSGVRALCGDDFWAALIEDADTKATYLNQMAANELRGDPIQSFTAFGITWDWYEGTSDCTIGTGAVAFPTAPGLFITRYAPADTMAAVGTRGLPYYVTPELIDHDKGVDLEGQMNPLNLCTRPAACIDLTVSA